MGGLEDLLHTLEPTGDVYGAEFYYNARINLWFHLTFDLQAVQPGFKSRDVAIVPALRAKIDFDPASLAGLCGTKSKVANLWQTVRLFNRHAQRNRWDRQVGSCGVWQHDIPVGP